MTPAQPAVANMSLGGGASTALDTAVNNSIADGVTYVVAAGNSNANACNSSPARVADGGHRRRDDPERRALVVLELRHLPRRLRARARASRRPGTRRTRRRTRSAARRWPRRTSRASAALVLQGSPDASPRDGQRARSSATRPPASWRTPARGSPNRLLFTPLRRDAAAAAAAAAAHRLHRRDDVHRHALGHRRRGHPSGRDLVPVDDAAASTAAASTARPGSDFDLYLQRWNGSSWVQVAAGDELRARRDGQLQRDARLLPLAGRLLPRQRELHVPVHPAVAI